MRASVYTKILNGEVEAAIIYQDELTFAILDHNPATLGHTLVIPKAQIDHLDDCPQDIYQALFDTVQKISKHLRSRLKPIRIALVVHGLDVPHAHVHVVPLYTGHELKLADRGETYKTQQELTVLANKLMITR